MSLAQTVALNNGVKMPQIGLGTWQSAPGEVEKAVKYAIQVGYRHIDAALIYGNQEEVAEGIRTSGVDRSDLFLVSKLWNNSHRPDLVEADLDKTLQQLQTSYLDLYLIHWPVPFQPGNELSATRAREDGGQECIIDTDAPSIAETWKEMVRIQQQSKKIRAIGVSNFSIKHLEKLISVTGVVPSVNQIEAHPLLYQQDLVEYCRAKGIHITAYSPLGQNITGKPPVIQHPKVLEVAEKLGRTPAQVLIAWGVRKGYSVIPKSVTPERIKSNFEQITLSEQDEKTISDIARQEGRTRYNVPVVYNPRWNINVFDEAVEQSAPVIVW